MIDVQISEALESGVPALGAPEQREAIAAVLSNAAGTALRVAGADPEGDLTVVLSNDAQLHRLNHQFLEVDAPTDVLSFPSGDPDPETETPYLGDVIISFERAESQAAAGDHRVEDELQLLVVHGVLHLLGHDHAEEDEKAAMWVVQTLTLEVLGCPLRP